MWWNDYIGVKFTEKGRDRNGVDCWGLVCLIYKELKGIELPSRADTYSSTKDKETIAALIEKWHDDFWVEVKEPEMFDVLVLKIAGVPFHVGIYLHDKKFIHCANGVGTVVERLDSLRWKNNLIGAYRWAM